MLILSFIECGENSISHDLFFRKVLPAAIFVVDHLIAENLTLIPASAKHCHSSVTCNFPSSPNDIRECTADYCLMDIGDFRSIRMQHKRGLSKSNTGASSPAGTRSPSLHCCRTCMKSYSLLPVA